MSARPPPAPPRFERQQRVQIAAVDGEFTQHLHYPTGARHIHLEAPFEDSAFLMAFLTPAPDSRGLTHVLEHLVMCGSERFPCRRAFFAMLGRTLSTTMNAVTTQDCTTFHFATRNLADYENLLSVYVDAAFFPRLERLDFDQEGWRVEIASEDGEGTVPVRRGVVLSEMRGLMSDPERQLGQALNRCLFPSAPYRFNAGGDPRAIPDLDHETLKAYHRNHYHPANVVFLSAGPLRPEWLHARLQDLALTPWSSRVPGAVPRAQWLEPPPLEAPTRSVVRYPVLGTRDRALSHAGVAMGWRLGGASQPMEVARAHFLARCLLAQDDAPIRRALLEASGGSAPAFELDAVQATHPQLVFRCGVQGCDPERAEEIEGRVTAAIDAVVRDGIAPSIVDGAFAHIEREQRERHDPRFPFPLKLLTRMLPAALYGGAPASALDAPAALAALHEDLRSRGGVAELVRWCLRDNPNRVLVTAVPDPAAGRRFDSEDRESLVHAYGPAHPEARRRVVERSRALRRRQGSSAGEESLPWLGIDEVGPARDRPELVALSVGGASSPARVRQTVTATAGTGSPPGNGKRRRVQAGGDESAPESASFAGAVGGPHVWLSRGPVGGLVYARLAIDIPDFDIGQLDDVGLLAELLPQYGHGRLRPDETRARLARYCDRLAVEPWMLARAISGPDARGGGDPRPVLLLSARTQAVDEDVLLKVLADARAGSRFDESARTAAAKARARRLGDLVRYGHLQAERVAAARLDAWAAVADRWHGPSALAVLARAAEDATEGEGLAERLLRVHQALASAPYQVQIVRDREERSNAESGRTRSGAVGRHPAPAIRGGPCAWSAVHGVAPESHGSPPPARIAPCRASATAAWVVEGPVNYCAMVFPAVDAEHPDAGPLAVLAAFLGGELLQRTVREHGGAYGAGARYCERSCTVRMFSYRDPRLAETLGDFHGALEALRRQPPEGRRLENAVLRTIREIDRAKAFQVHALERFLDELQGRGRTGEPSLRTSVLGVDPERLRDVAGRYLSPEQGAVGVLAGTGSEAELERLELPWRRP